MSVKIFTNLGEQIPIRGYTQSQSTSRTVTQILDIIGNYNYNAFYTRCESGYRGVEVIGFNISSDTIHLCDKDYLEVSENWQSIIAADRGINDYQSSKKFIYADGWSITSIYSNPYTEKTKSGITYYYTFGDQNSSDTGMGGYIGMYLPSTVTNILINQGLPSTHYLYNQEEPTAEQMALIYNWLQAGIS